MKLNTKNIFLSSKKLVQKTKTKNIKKSKKNYPFTNSNKAIKKLSSNNNINSNKNKKTLQSSNKKVNPFILSSEENQDLKYSKLSKFSIQKIIINLDFDEKNDKNDLFEDSYVNNMVLTSESDSNKGNKDNIIYKQNQNELCLERVNNLFKKSNLKSTIIVDNNGNNNLNFEQKRIINDYFNKKRNNINNVNNSNKKDFKKFHHSNTRKISTEIYKDNNIFNKFSRLKSATIGNISKNFNNDKIIIEKKITNKNKNEIENYSKNKNNYINIENNYEVKNKKRKIYKKMKSAKINSYFFINSDKFIIKKEEKTKVEEENNSLFENNSHCSFSSSFLGSSMDEDFYKALNNN